MSKKSKKSRKPSPVTGSAAFRKLYDAAVRILMLQPWNHFTSGDFLYSILKTANE